MPYTGQKGRKALTSEQKSAKQRASFNPAPMRAAAELPKAPPALCDTAAAEWSRVGRYLLATERVASVDYQVLAAYCSAFAAYSDAMQAIWIHGQPLWVMSNQRPKRSIFADIACEQGKDLLRLARKFGMTARTRHLDHGRTGRPALPAEIHQLRGTTAKRKRRGTNAISLDFPATDVAPPEWFHACDVGQEWTRLVTRLTCLDLWTPLDVGPVVLSACSFALAMRCYQQLRSEGLAVQVSDELASQNPLVTIRSRHFDLCESIWEDYGMSPYDRSNFYRVDSDESDDSPSLEIFPRDINLA